MVRVDDALLRQVTATIVEVADPEQVILLVLDAVETLTRTRTWIWRWSRPNRSGLGGIVAPRRHALGALAKFHVPTDILVYSADEANRWREGGLLYERP
ncbi:MAG: hypothetical protein F4145_17655 [Boseongicola sp. SB0675_bin_26]|nr:hypothetical protein [Boseongicola sp. SB0675_bin_26]